MDYDPFNLTTFEDLDTLSEVLVNLTTVLEVVKIFMAQQGFTGSGLNVGVIVATKPVNLIM